MTPNVGEETRKARADKIAKDRSSHDAWLKFESAFVDVMLGLTIIVLLLGVITISIATFLTG